jgi:hypothetical protein
MMAIRTLGVRVVKIAGTVAVLAGACCGAQATENQSLRALLGAPGQEMVLPQSPGLYGQVWFENYHASSFKDGKGREQSIDVGSGVSAVRGGSVDAQVVVPRLTYISETYWGEGRLGISVTLPFIRMDATTTLDGRFPAGFPSSSADAVQSQLDMAAAASSKDLLSQGDTEIAPFIDMQDDEARLVLLAALVAPTGDYEPDRSVNAGSGRFWTFRPGVLYGRAWDNGLEFGTRATYSINGVNTATDVRSGQYLHIDYSLMYRFTDQWRGGLHGYAVKQFTKDTGPDVAADGNKAQVFALGPAVSFQSEDGAWGAEFKVLPEFLARNRPQGITTWLRWMVRLD